MSTQIRAVFIVGIFAPITLSAKPKQLRNQELRLGRPPPAVRSSASLDELRGRQPRESNP